MHIALAATEQVHSRKHISTCCRPAPLSLIEAGRRMSAADVLLPSLRMLCGVDVSLTTLCVDSVMQGRRSCTCRSPMLVTASYCGECLTYQLWWNAPTSAALQAVLLSMLQVLYLTEAIDEVVFTNLATYDGKQLMDVSREGLEMDEEEGSKVCLLTVIISFPPCSSV